MIIKDILAGKVSLAITGLSPYMMVGDFPEIIINGHKMILDEERWNNTMPATNCNGIISIPIKREVGNERD